MFVFVKSDDQRLVAALQAAVNGGESITARIDTPGIHLPRHRRDAPHRGDTVAGL
jgi:hypothetical protein